LPEGIHRSTLLREDEAIVVRAGHPLTHSKVTKERLIEFPHLLVAPTGAEENEVNGFMNDERVARRTWIERVLHEFQDGKIDLAGRATVCVPHFAAMAPFLQLTDMVATLPRRLALWAAARAPLVLLDLPYTSMTVDVEMLWDQSADQDQGLQWLVNELAASMMVSRQIRRSAGLRGCRKLGTLWASRLQRMSCSCKAHEISSGYIKG
jgi:DNA-binding transcriptional LysR family regulator